jgi:hypothetical protein
MMRETIENEVHREKNAFLIILPQPPWQHPQALETIEGEILSTL